MAGLRMTDRSYVRRNGKRRHGFTMVELIVILVIIAILAAAGVATALGYVKKAKFDKNNQEAISVYQTAQTALADKMANGTVESWIKKIPGFDKNDVDLNSESETNFSQHKTVSLTFNPKTSGEAEDKYLYDFLSPYFYYPTVFSGTMSVEFDICITKNNGHLSYSANILSAFYSAENKSDLGGWDGTCLGGSTDGLPNRSESYRRSTSLVGYYAGSDGDSVVSSVMIPWDSDYELEGHVVGPVEDDRQAKGYLFNLRNAETLDVSWAIFDDDRDPEREDDPEYTYTYSLNPDHDEKLYIYIIDFEDDTNKIEILVDPDALDAVVYGSDEYVTYEVIDGNNITRKSVTGFITLKVIRGDYVDTYVDGNTPDATKCRNYTFPITRTLVTGDPRTGCPTDKDTGYYEYSLALDSIRVRTNTAYSDTNASIYNTYYGSARLFGDSTPRNICALLGKASTWNYTDKNGATQANTDLYDTYAARAINDPVYYEGAGMRDGELKYCYQVKEHCGKFDGEDNTEMYEEYVITGTGVVNTFFGDKVYDNTKDPTGHTHLIGGTTWGATDKSAVLTNCRHLYNIGLMTSNDVVTYRVVSDINWYLHETYKEGDSESLSDKYATDVRVFTTSGFHAPVSSDGLLNVVSFPAISVLKSNSTLTSISDANRKIYSINNIQLRRTSFINQTDAGYALICKNEGIIYNLYANNISNIFTTVDEGEASDYSKINVESAEVTDVTISGVNKQPVAALIGYNKGTIGSSTETLDNRNTVRVSNSVVMSGGYWQCNTNFTDVGCVIGKNSERSEGVISTYGVIEVCGSFGVVGYKSAGGVIGYNEASIGARLVVDGTDYGKPEFNMPAIKVGDTYFPCSCAIVSRYRAGGAIGYFDGGANGKRYFIDKENKYSITDNNFDPLDDADFNIVVDLPEDGLIANLEGGSNDASSAGAISCLYNVAGDYLSIRTRIEGKIICGYAGTSYSHTGGAIGKEFGKQAGTVNNSTVKCIYLDCTNYRGSVIGSVNASYGATAAGGAIGKFETTTTNLDRTVVINVANYGAISARGNSDSTGAGGAIGGAGRSTNTFIVKAINGTSSTITGYGNDMTKTNGTGGAFGGLGESGNNNYYLPAESWIYVVNYGTISGPNRVGGAIGSSSTNSGSVYAENHGTISGGYFVGGAVGCNPKDQRGSITSVLDGAEISGASYVGGAIGRCMYFRDTATLETDVYGSSSIYGSEYLVGGVGGDVVVADEGSTAKIKLLGTSTNPTLTVTGDLDGVGGAVGLLRSQYTHSVNITMSSQTDLDRVAVVVNGQNDVGGVIGRLLSCSNNNFDKYDPTLFYKSPAAKDIKIQLDVNLNPRNQVIGTGENVGGVIGMVRTSGAYFTGHVNVTSKFTPGDGAIVIEGTNNVGGAIGKMEVPAPYNNGSGSGINVDFTSYPVNVTATVSGEASDANAGGAVGCIVADTAISNTDHFVITANLGKSQIIAEGSNVGGAVGFNNGSLAASEVEVTLYSGGRIEGGGKVGGAIGYNFCKQIRGMIHSVKATINGDVIGTGTGVGAEVGSGKWRERRTTIGTGDCVGGAIGYNLAVIENVDVTVEGNIRGSADSVGGAIGYVHSDAKVYWIINIDTKLQGNAEIKGKYNVGGSVGENICNIYNIKTKIIGTAHIIGEMRVGGSVGFASAKPGQGGDDIRDGKYWGRIDTITTEISADYALSGDSRIGGSVGQQGDKWGSGNDYISAALITVEAELNTAYLFDAGETGPDDIEGSACVGGVYGIFVDGRVGGLYKEYAYKSNGTWGETGKSLTGEGAVLSGSGGLVKLDVPNQSYTHAVLISAKGRSVGGIVGQIGVEAQNTKETWLNQNVCMSEIKVVEGGPNICVVSVNGADRIGGWIGSGFAAHGGIGADKTTDPMVTYNVETVRAVFSEGDYVGGFCGYHSGFNNNSTQRNYTHAHINVVLDNATVIGRTSVGGVFGGAVCCCFNQGSITAEFKNRTNIGDITGNAMPGDNTGYDAYCYEAGGVFGSIANTDRWNQTRASSISVAVDVTFDETSRVCGYAEADNSILAAADAGVGGIFGRCSATVSSDNPVRVVCTYPGSVSKVNETDLDNDDVSTSVYSKYSNAGGIAGVTNSSCTLKNCYALISVRGDAKDACVGGVVGKMVNGSISYSHFGIDSKYNPTTDTKVKEYNYYVGSIGANALTGGFVGSCGSIGTISNCYSTATVKAVNGTATGGFAGQTSTGTIEYAYVGGHTYSGQYLSNSGDVTGAGNVGGFVGQTAGAVTFNNCYSTASVSGTGTNAGGFVGSRNDATVVKNSYCTGLVIAKEGTVAGTFAGTSAATNFTSTYTLDGINNVEMKLIGSLDAGTTVTNLSPATSETINGHVTYGGHPFDQNLGNSFPYRAVISADGHWGDWPTVVSGTRNIAGLEIFLNPDSFEYDKDGVTVDSVLRIYDESIGRDLRINDEYTLTYTNNDRVGTAQVMITGVGNYSGAISLPFTIVEKSLKTATVEIVKPDDAEYAEYEYTGAPIEPKIKVKIGDDELVINTDFYLTYVRDEQHDGDHTEIGTIVVTVHGTGNYKDAADATGTFKIVGRDIGKADVTLTNASAEERIYTGNPITPGVVVRIDGRTLKQQTDVEPGDYTVAYDNNVHAGTAKITITPCTNEYSGEKVVTFEITTATNEVKTDPVINGWTWKADNIAGLTVEPETKFGDQYDYSVYSEDTCTDPDKCHINKVDKDTLNEQLKDLNAGTYYLLAEVKMDEEHPNDYGDAFSIVPFTVTPADIAGVAEVTLEYTSIAHSGEALTPSVTVTYKSEVLDAANYTVAYADNVEPGTATVTVTGQNNCIGAVTAQFTINPMLTITFNANGEDAELHSPTTVQVEKGKGISEPEDLPTRPGYRFAYWCKDASELSGKYVFGSEVNEEFTLYAIWIKVYKITYVLYENVEVYDEEDENVELEQPADPVRPGYEFAGWYSNPEGNGTDNPWHFNNLVDGPKTIYAHWTQKDDVKVTFDTHGGTTIGEQDVLYNGLVTKPENPTCEGKVFGGWYTDEGYTTEFDFETQRVTTPVTLHAKWDEPEGQG